MARSTPFSDLGQAFLSVLPEPLKPHTTGEPRVLLRGPPKAAEVGALAVHDDGDELIVAIGHIDHRHFEVYCEAGLTQPEREQRAAEEAMHWIQDIIADRVRFRNEFSAGRLIAGSSWHPGFQDGGKLLQSTDEFREYTWSGEKAHEHQTSGE